MTRQAVRVLAAVVIAGVVLAIVLGLGTQGSLSGRDFRSRDDVYALVVFAALVGGMAVMVARRPTVRRTVVWALASWFATIGYFVFVEPRSAFKRPYDATMSLLGLLVMTGPIVAACALRAAEVGFDSSEPLLAHRLRSLFRVMLGIAIVLSILALFPGQAEYRDTNDCLGLAFVAHGEPRCTPSFTDLDHTRMAGGPFVFLVLVVVLSPIQIAYRAPQRQPIWAWTVWILLGSAALGVLALGMSFNLAIFSHIETLGAQQGVLLGLGVLACMLLVVLPAVFALTREDKVPRARVA